MYWKLKSIGLSVGITATDIMKELAMSRLMMFTMAGGKRSELKEKSILERKKINSRIIITGAETVS